MEQRERFNPWHVFLASTLLLSLVALYQLARPVYESGRLFFSMKWMVVVGLGILGVAVEAVLLAVSWTSLQGKLFRGLDSGLQALKRLQRFNLLFFAATIGIFCFLVFGHYGRYLENIFTRLFLFWLAVLAGSIFLKASGLQRSWGELLGASLLFVALGYRIAVFIPEISTYPFTLNWSEASRYYYASLFFSGRIYGVSVPPTVLHPSRYLLQAVPFLIPDSPLWLHRFWQVFLWVGTTLLSAFVLARRLNLTDELRRWMLVAWAFLFLLLGPVYYHLQVPLILVLWGVDTRAGDDRRTTWLRFGKSLLVILLASAWAGISRINWFPVPGMLAAALYFLEQPAEKQSVWRYLVKPAVWALLGTGIAFAAQAAYVVLSGNEAELFTTSFSSDLLWYRLFPNPTYPAGILPAALIVSLPPFLLILQRLAGRWKSYHFIRLLGLAAILLVLLAGGLVVSTKIGGGSNLHNLDAYLALIIVITAYIFFGKFTPEQTVTQQEREKTSLWSTLRIPVIALALIIPAYEALILGGPLIHHSQEQTEKSLASLSRFVNAAASQGGEVLFIAERQLLTFHDLQEVELVPDYERVFLMEMAMSGSPEYLGKFHEDLKNQRFALIVSEPLYIQYKGNAESFGEENDAWVNQVSQYVLCYYEPEKIIREPRLQLLVPRADVSDCP